MTVGTYLLSTRFYNFRNWHIIVYIVLENGLQKVEDVHTVEKQYQFFI